MVRTKLKGKKSSIKKKNSTIRLLTSQSTGSRTSSVSSSEGKVQDLDILVDTNYESSADARAAIVEFYEKKVEIAKKVYEESKENMEKFCLEQINSYPESYLSQNIRGSLKDIDENTWKSLNPLTAVNGKPNLKQKTSKEEPSDFKKPRTPRRTSKRTSRQRSLSAPTRAPPPPPEFKTPLNSYRQQMASLKTITPKICNTPVSVMRRPQHGEVAFSTSGSPLLIGPVSREDIPTVSVPMQDGRVFSILPDPGMPPPDLPNFDDETKKYLKTLREHLAMLSQSP